MHSRSSSCVYEIIKPTSALLGGEGEVILKPNLAETAKLLETGFNTLKKHLDAAAVNTEESKVEFKGIMIKRISVFYPNGKYRI